MPSGDFSSSEGQSEAEKNEESKSDGDETEESGEDIDESSNNGDDGSETEITSSDNTQPEPPTLEEYLSRLRCTGCSRRCILTNPHCSKGVAKAATAEIEYYEIYGE